MRLFIFLSLLLLTLLCFSGCYSREGYPTTFESQYRQLERETKYYTEKDFFDADKRSADDKRSMSEGDRQAAVAAEAQKERRAKTVVESDYYFQVYPGRQESYSYNEYNEVWSDGYPLNAYKENRRLWEKPKRHKPADYVGYPDEGLVAEEVIAAAEESARKAEEKAAGEANAVYQ